MSAKIEQLELIIAEQRKIQTPEELLEYIIKLYGDEFIKANDEIFRLRKALEQTNLFNNDEIAKLSARIKACEEAGDEVFKIKQKVVIVNRELITKNLELVRENDLLRATLEKSARKQHE
jgi:hypothetical protein